MHKAVRRVSPAMVVALLALFVALSGTAVAAGVVPLAKRSLSADNAKKLQGDTKAQIAAAAAALPRPGKQRRGTDQRQVVAVVVDGRPGGRRHRRLRRGPEGDLGGLRQSDRRGDRPRHASERRRRELEGLRAERRLRRGRDGDGLRRLCEVEPRAGGEVGAPSEAARPPRPDPAGLHVVPLRSRAWSGTGPVAQPVFKTGPVWQPHACSVRLRGRSAARLPQPARERFSRGWARPGISRRRAAVACAHRRQGGVSCLAR